MLHYALHWIKFQIQQVGGHICNRMNIDSIKLLNEYSADNIEKYNSYRQLQTHLRTNTLRIRMSPLNPSSYLY